MHRATTGPAVVERAVPCRPRHGLLLRAVLGPSQNTGPRVGLTGLGCMPNYISDRLHMTIFVVVVAVAVESALRWIINRRASSYS
jgi:hypothetical protein